MALKQDPGVFFIFKNDNFVKKIHKFKMNDKEEKSSQY